MRRIVGKTRIAHRFHGRMCAQHHGERLSVLTLPFEPQAGAAEAAQHKPRLERAENRPGQQPVSFDRVHQFRLTADDVTGDEIAVARKRFGGAGHHEVGAKRQRLLAQRRRGGVVDDQNGAAAAAGHRQMVQVDDVQAGVDWSLGQHHIGVGGGSAEVGALGLDNRNPLRCKVFVRVPAHLVVAIGGHHELGAGFGEHTERRRDRCHTGAERQCRRRTFEFSQRRFQLAPRRIGATPVAVHGLRFVGRQVIRRRRNGWLCHWSARNCFRSNGFDTASGIAVLAVHLPTPAWCCAPAAAQRPDRQIIPCGRRDAPRR